MGNIVILDLENNTVEKRLNTEIKSIEINEDDLVFESSKLSGYGILGINRINIYSNNNKSNSGGYFSHYMKCNGYDYIIIKNKCYYPVYVYINEENVVIKNANMIWSKDIDKTREILEKELNNKNIEIAQIGIAGVNKLDFSKIIFGKEKSCGKNGLGKLMAEKNLKAIVLNKSENLQCNEWSKIEEINEKICNKLGNNNLNDYYNENNTCYGCYINCKSTSIKKILKYNFNEEEATKIDKLCNYYGMDSIVSANIIDKYKIEHKVDKVNIEDIVEDIINKKYTGDTLNSNVKKRGKMEDRVEILLEELGFCKFLIKRNILDSDDIDTLTSIINHL